MVAPSVPLLKLSALKIYIFKDRAQQFAAVSLRSWGEPWVGIVNWTGASGLAWVEAALIQASPQVRTSYSPIVLH